MKKIVFLLFLGLIGVFSVTAQEDEGSDEADMAKAAQNPVASIYSLPFQNNTVWGVGPYDRPQNILNIQPVIPIPIGSKINMINRIIMPVITMPSGTEDASSTGFGDISYTMWFSPAKAGKVIWGVGPVFQLGTASDDIFGSGEFGIGPSLVVLTMPGSWVTGAVINNVKTYGDAEENKFLFNPFANYNFDNFYMVSGPIITANWNAPDGQKWVVPFGGGAGKVFKLGGKLPTNIAGHVYYNAVRPDGMGAWQTRFQLTFMMPTKATMKKMKAAGKM